MPPPHTAETETVFKINHAPTKIKNKTKINGCEILLKKRRRRRRKACPCRVVSSADLMTWTCYIWPMVIGGQDAFHRHPYSLPQLGHYSPPEGTSYCLGWKFGPLDPQQFPSFFPTYALIPSCLYTQVPSLPRKLLLAQKREVRHDVATVPSVLSQRSSSSIRPPVLEALCPFTPEGRGRRG